MILVLLGSTQAASLYVCDPIYTSCYASIADAVAASVDGDVIYLDDDREFTETLHLVDRDLDFVARSLGSVPWSSDEEPALTIEGGDIGLYGLSFISGSAGAISQSEGNLVVSDCQFYPATRYGNGGAIHSEYGVLTIDDTIFEGGHVFGFGGHVYTYGSDLTISGSRFEAATASYAAAVWSNGGDLVQVEDSTFVDCNSTVGYGAIATAYPDSVVLTGNTFDGNRGTPGAAWITASDITIDENVFVGNVTESADFYYGYYQSALQAVSSSFTMRRNLFCANVANTNTELGTTARIASLHADISNNIFVENFNGSMYLTNSADTQVVNNAFIGNFSPYGAELVLADATYNLVATVQRNIFAWNTDGYGGIGPILTYNDWHTIGNNLFWENIPETSTSTDPTAIFADPRLEAYLADGECRIPQSIYDADEMWPAWDSPVRDAGALSSPLDADWDGSPVDIGPFGGRESRRSPDWLDSDDDGVPNLLDCAPMDELISSIAADAVYDGVDSNCDGASEYDADQDGQEAEQFGGLDCDDQDPKVYLGAEELPYDGVDQSCDGLDLVDVDGDGYGVGLDCNDKDDRIYPGAPDEDLNIDWDCDGYADPRVGLSQVGCATPGAPVALLALLAAVGIRRRRS